MNGKKIIRWIMEKSKKQRLKLCALVILDVLFSLLSVAFAFAIKYIIDGATSGVKEKLIGGAIALVAIIILQFAFRLLTNGLTEHIRGKLEITFKSLIFGDVLNKKYDKISSRHSGELMTRITNDVSVVCDGVIGIAPLIVSASARLIAAVVSLVLIDWIFAVAFSVAGVLVFLIIALSREKLKSLHNAAQETEGKTRSFMQECIENLLAIKVFSANERIEARSDKLQEENFKVKMKRKNYSALGHASYNFVFSAGYLFALIYGSVKIFTGAGMGYGDLSAILQLVNNVQVPFASISGVLPKYYAMLASAERLMEIEAIENESGAPAFDRDGLYAKMRSVSIDGVTFSYGRDVVLSDAVFTVNKGDFVAVTGVSGVGKSTLVKLLLGIYDVEKGKIYLSTDDGTMPVDRSTRSLFSYVPQGNMLFSGDIEENVKFIVPEASDEEVKRALEISCAQEFINELPEGIKTKVGEKGVGLSEGQVQRIAIARAVLSRAPILLLDEATSALDEDTEYRVLKNVKSIEGVTLIIISHKKAALAICNRHVKISDKKVIES